jgi:AbrB family looped-hinge helix DNA binding protein
MKTTIDRAGRVVIPAAIREKAGFTAGTELEVTIDDGSVRLIRRVPGPRLVRVGKRLVARPTVPPAKMPRLNLADLVAQERDRGPW